MTYKDDRGMIVDDSRTSIRVTIHQLAFVCIPCEHPSIWTDVKWRLWYIIVLANMNPVPPRMNILQHTWALKWIDPTLDQDFEESIS